MIIVFRSGRRWRGRRNSDHDRPAAAPSRRGRRPFCPGVSESVPRIVSRAISVFLPVLHGLGTVLMVDTYCVDTCCGREFVVFAYCFSFRIVAQLSFFERVIVVLFVVSCYTLPSINTFKLFVFTTIYTVGSSRCLYACSTFPDNFFFFRLKLAETTRFVNSSI